MRKITWSKWKKVSEEIYQEGYIEGCNDTSKEILDDLKRSDAEDIDELIKKWEKRVKDV